MKPHAFTSEQIVTVKLISIRKIRLIERGTTFPCKDIMCYFYLIMFANRFTNVRTKAVKWNKMKIHWLQLCSSEKSPQSLSPSQIQLGRIHFRSSAQRSLSPWHATVTNSVKLCSLTLYSHNEPAHHAAIITGWPKKVNHYQVSSLNRIKNRY